MIPRPKTHRIAVSDCRHTGATCPALERMLKALCQALNSAKGLTDEDFEISGESQLDGCDRQCAARFFASHDRIRVFGGAEASAQQSGLERFADMLLTSEGSALPAGCLPSPPCAMGQALPQKTAPDTASYSIDAHQP